MRRPAEVKEDVKQMQDRSRVSLVLNSEAFRKELEWRWYSGSSGSESQNTQDLSGADILGNLDLKVKIHKIYLTLIFWVIWIWKTKYTRFIWRWYSGSSGSESQNTQDLSGATWHRESYEVLSLLCVGQSLSINFYILIFYIKPPGKLKPNLVGIVFW
jgi:hypothetical protein